MLALLLAAALASAGPGVLPPAPVERLLVHPLEQDSVPVEVVLGGAPAGRYALLLQADGLTLEERTLVLAGEPRRVVLHAPPGARDIRVNGVVARESAPGPAVETSTPVSPAPPLWLLALAGAPGVLLLAPRLRRWGERAELRAHYPEEYEALGSLRRFDRTCAQRRAYMAMISSGLDRRIRRVPGSRPT